MTDSSLTILGELTKPATVLIEKISDAVGGVFKPFQIVRVARAEAEADQIRASAEIRVTDLHRRALHRFLEEEAKKQSNMEHITARALPLLDEAASPQSMESDWISNFFEKSRIVSDAEMQGLWSRLLAGQANAPGAFSRRTVNLLGDLERSDAELFTHFCGFCGQFAGSWVPLVTDVNDSVYQAKGINFSTLSHLESLGLIQFNNLAGYVLNRLPRRFFVHYFGEAVELTGHKDEANTLEVGVALLTKAGGELASICGATAVDGFLDHMKALWKARSLLQ